MAADGTSLLSQIDAKALWGKCKMQDDLTRAQRYHALANDMESLAGTEPDERRRAELLGLAQQYRKLADKLIKEH